MRTWSKSPKRYLFLILFLASLVLISCTQETELLPRVWVDSPREGAALTFAQPVVVYSHAYARDGIAEVVLSVDGEPYKRTAPAENGVDFSDIQQEWLPPGDGTYILQVVVYDLEGAKSNPATLTIRIGGNSMEEVVSDPVLDDPTVTPVVEQVLDCPPTATILTSANCRVGPGDVYGVISSFAESSQAVVRGQSQDGYWWVVDSPGTGGTCWIWEELVSLSTDTCSVATIESPPTPQPAQDSTAPPVPSPSVPANGLALDCRSYQNLVWMPVQDDSGIAGYYVKMEKEVSLGNWQAVNQWGPIQGKQHEVPVECGVQHRWSVRAEDGAGNFSAWSAFSNFIINLD